MTEEKRFPESWVRELTTRKNPLLRFCGVIAIINLRSFQE